MDFQNTDYRPKRANKSPQRARKMRKLSGLTENLIAPAMRKRAQILTKIVAGWPEIAGEAHLWCLPADIHFPANSRINGTLSLSVASARAPQVQMMTAQLCKRINSYCGYSVVTRLRVRQDFSPARNPTLAKDIQAQPDKIALARLEKVTANIQNPELRAALIRLGQNLSQNKS